MAPFSDCLDILEPTVLVSHNAQMNAKRRLAAKKPAPSHSEAGGKIADDDLPGSFSSRFVRVKRFVLGVASVGAVLGGLAGYWNAYRATDSAAQSSSHLLATLGNGDAGPLSIVVLPFENLTGDSSQSYFVDGLTATVTSDLSQLKDTFVVSAASAYSYKEKSLTIRQIGSEFGVRFALKAGVQRSGDTFRIIAQLYNVSTNSQLWADNFEGQVNDFFAVQDVITARIGNSIGREMLISAIRSGSIKNDAQTANVLLRAEAIKLLPVSQANYENALSLYRTVLSREPFNAEAMVGAAVIMGRQVENGFVNDQENAEKKIDEAYSLASKARAIDSSLPDAYFALSLCATARGDFLEAKRFAQTALSLDLMNPIRYNAVAVAQFNLAEAYDALETLTRGIQLDPKRVDERLLTNMGRVQFMLGNDDASIAWSTKALDTNPNRTLSLIYLSLSYARKGDIARSREIYQSLVRLDPGMTHWGYSAQERALRNEAYSRFIDTQVLPAAKVAGFQT